MTHESVVAGAAPGSGAMFDGIARRYDLLNRILALGLDASWRRRAARALELEPESRVLDVATGTGDLALAIATEVPTAKVVGIDPSPAMLELALAKIDRLAARDRVSVKSGHAESLPFQDDSFDAVTIAFGIRNVKNRPQAMAELLRVTRPGGRLAILELMAPEGGWLSLLAQLHVRLVVPLVGRLLAGAAEYRYLRDSILAFPRRAAFVSELSTSGLQSLEVTPLACGACCLFVGSKGCCPGESIKSQSLAYQTETSGLRRSLLPAIAEARHERQGLTFCWPAPVVEVETALRALRAGDEAMVFAPPGGRSVVARGVAKRLRVADSGPTWPDVKELRRLATQSLGELFPWQGEGAIEAPSNRFFGGLAFSPASVDSVWRGFGSGLFVLPRLRYERDGSEASLTLVLTAEDCGAPEGQRFCVELERTLERLRRAANDGDSEKAGEAPHIVDVDDESDEGWIERVESIRRAIAEGHFTKAVAVRGSRLVLDLAPRIEDVVGALRRGNPTCTLFLLQASGAAFLGASPERLVSLCGSAVAAEALAGTIERGLDPRQAARLLLDSAKDKGEHLPVVRHLVDRLAPLCTQLDWSAEPSAYELAHIVHLRTPIEGRLKDPGHVLDLVSLLHPTPAVAGAPVSPAVRWIEENEPMPRGWFAGPIGWFDSSGDGEFWVALRSCLLSGVEARVYAGAGIVRESVAEKELAEAHLKERAILEALRVGTPLPTPRVATVSSTV